MPKIQAETAPLRGGWHTVTQRLSHVTSMSRMRDPPPDASPIIAFQSTSEIVLTKMS